MAPSEEVPISAAFFGWIVMQILGAGVVLERLVVGNVVADGFDGVITGESGVVRGADGLALGIEASGSEAALEPAPGDVLGVEQVADVRARDRDHGGGLESGDRSARIHRLRDADRR